MHASYTIQNATVQHTDAGAEYTVDGHTVAFEGEWVYGDVYFDGNWVGEYVRMEGVCWVEGEALGERRVGETEEDYVQFAQQLCEMFA